MKGSRKETGNAVRWWVTGAWFRRSAWMFLVLFVGFAGYLLLFNDDVSTRNYVSAAINVLVLISVLLTARMGSRADPGGLAVVQYRTRRVPWADVVSLQGEGSRWGAGNVTAHLIGGERVQLLGVPHDDLPLLERFCSHDTNPA